MKSGGVEPPQAARDPLATPTRSSGGVLRSLIPDAVFGVACTYLASQSLSLRITAGLPPSDR